MGFALTILYIVVTIISPEQFGKEWATYHVLIYLAVITAIASLPSMAAHRYWKSAQSFLLLAFIFAIALSQVANGWFGGALQSWRAFLPSAAIFFFIVVNVTTIRRLKIATWAMIGSCLIVATEALFGYYTGFYGDTFILQNNIYSPQDDVIGQLTRLRGAGFLSDPNDFAQILLIALPLAFMFWRKRHLVANFFAVILPAALILWATYLTHSRGGLIALAAVALVAARNKLGTTKSVILAALFIVGMLALDFTGGRGISAADGADRLEAWANGLEMFKRSPLYGIGFSNFTDNYEITAHNSFVLCLAELGLLGSMLWLGLLVTTTMNLNRIIAGPRRWLSRPLFGLRNLFEASYLYNYNTPALTSDPMLSSGTIALEQPPASEGWSISSEAVNSGSEEEPARAPESIVPAQINVMLRLGLVAFITTAWFLSRSYTTTMYLLLGLATSAIALQRDDEPQQPSRWILCTVALEVVLVALIYCLVRLRH